MLLVADFQRQGSDLVLVGPDGETIFIRGYFAQEHPPVLLTDSGARVTPELASSLAGPGGQPESIGTVEVSDGDVFIRRTDGTRVRGEKGTEVYQGDVVETGDAGSLGVVLADDTTFSLGENGRLVLDELVYDPGTQTGTSAISVVQGVFTFVSGQIAKTGPDAMTVTTPVASIGIRGTTVAGRAAAEGETNTITLLADDAGRVGEISISNAGGIQVLSVANQTTQVTSFFSPPAAPVVLAQAQVQQLFGAAMEARPPQPTRQDSGEEAAADQQDAEGEGEVAEGEVAEGEGTEGEGEATEGEGEGEATEEGEAGPGDEQLAAGPDGPGLEGGPEGGPDGPGPDGEVLTPEEQAAKSALEAAIAGGASAEEAFAAAAEAATQEALAQGADPAEVEAAKVAVEAAFQQALASGADPESAMATAMAAVGAPGDFGGQGDFGGSGDFGFGGSGDFGFGGAGDFGFGGTGFDTLGFDDPFDFGLDDPFGFDDGFDFGLEPIDAPEEFTFIDDPNDPTAVEEQPITAFDELLLGTAANDTLVGTSLNTNFYFSYPTAVGGTDTVTDAGGQNQIAFDILDNVKFKFSMGGSADAGNISVWADFDGASAVAESAPTSTIGFSGVTQYLFSDISVAALQGGYTSQSEVDPSAQTDPIDNSGDVIVMPSLAASDVGYVYAGTSGADTFNLSSATDGMIVFGKGGGDTFNIQVATEALLIGGITGTDNVDSNTDGIPDTGINAFSYASLFSGTTGIAATLAGDATPGPSGDAFVKENVGSPTLSNVLWDVGAFTGSAGNDQINVNGGGYSAINGDAGDDVVVLGGSAKVGTIDGGAGTGDVFRAIYNNTATVTGSVLNFETVQLGGSATADALDFSTHTTSGQVFGVTVNSVDAGSGVDSVALLANTATTMAVANAETITALGTGDDTVNLGTSLLTGTSIDLGGGTADTVNLLAGANTASISNVESIKGTTGADNLTLENTQSAGTTVDLLGAGDVLNLAAGTNILSILNVEAVNGTTSADILTVQNVLAANQTIDMGGGVDTLTLGNASNYSLTVLNAETITGGAGSDTLTYLSGTDFSGVTVTAVENIRLDSDNNDAGVTTLTVDSATVLSNATVAVGAATNHTHISSDDGLTLTGSSLFSGSSGTNSIIIDSGGDSAAILTVDGSTNFTAGGGTTEIREQEGGTGAADEIVQSTNGMILNNVVLVDIASIKIDSDNAGTSGLTVNSGTNLSTAAIIGGTDNNDTISVTGTVSFATNTLTNIAAIVGESGADNITGSAGADLIYGGQGIDTVTGGGAADVFAFRGGSNVGGAGSFTNAQSLGTDIFTDSLSGTDLFALANTDFALGSSGTLSATANSLTYIETATAITGAPADTNGADTSTGAGLIVVGAATGTAGVQIWWTTAQEAADTTNSYQIGTVNGANTADVSNTDFTLIA